MFAPSLCRPPERCFARILSFSRPPASQNIRFLSIAPRDSRPRISQLWIPTGGIAPSAEDNNEIIAPLVRGGFLRQAYSGVFHLLPLGLRVQEKIEALVDRHMRSLGANKLSLATITSEALWRKSGRFTGNNPEMFKLAAPEPTGYLLSPTHEEEITNIIANSVTSYKDLPLRLYQISRKYRNELRPRAGLLRTREFLMKDLYTFDTSPTAALETYHDVKAAYYAFFSELRVPFLVADADTGMMGGDLSHEFHFATPAGEDTIFSCDACGFAVNEELAEARLVKPAHRSVDGNDQWGPCPKCKGLLKSQRAVELGHTFYLGTRYSEPLGAFVGLPQPLPEGSLHRNNESEYKRVPVSMGCHGIGLSRLIGACASILSSPTYLAWPRAIAPYDVLIMSALKDADADMAALYDALTGNGTSVNGTPVDAVLDDREESVGWKFRDAELVGYPVVLVLGRAWRSQGRVEVQCRRLGLKQDVQKDDVVGFVRELLGKL